MSGSVTVDNLRKILAARGQKGLWKLKKDELLKLYHDTQPKESLEEKVPTYNVYINPYEEILKGTHQTVDRYVKLKQLGKKGKEGTTFLVIDSQTEKPYAMKCFKKQKSSATLVKEAAYQMRAFKAGVAPEVFACDRDKKCIVMTLLDRSLMDIIKSNDGHIPDKYQYQLLSLYRLLDDEGIVHNDANPLNVMEKDDRLYLIDYGFTKESSHKDFKKYKRPNEEIMVIGLLLWMHKLKIPTKGWKILRDSIDPQVYKSMKLDTFE